MTICHHPSEETLMRHATGSLPAGVGLVIAAHVEGCAICRQRVAEFEAVGGEMIAGARPMPLSEDLLAQTLARLERTAETSGAMDRPVQAPRRRPKGLILPRSLDRYDASPWRWIGPGIHLSRIIMPNAPDANVIILKVAPNKVMPEHGHSGTEYTQVLTGSLIDRSVTLQPGDLMEADHEVEHQPVAGAGSVCISLAAVEGKLQVDGLIGRMVLSMVGL